MENVETLALKILDNSNNGTKESIWIEKNAISYAEIDKIFQNFLKIYP